MSDERVCVVVGPTFGAQLESLDKAHPIWIVQSPTNDPVIAELWGLKTGDITSFHSREFDQLIDVVNMHHPDWRELDVHGLSAEDAAAALREFAGSYSPTRDGFLFKRSNP
ncbi:unnamed protein product [Phaeothamnion confervicola]